MRISKSIEFDAGHRVPNHKSKCSNPHGHRYKVTVVLEGDVITEAGVSDEGMVMDFGDLKVLMTELIHDVLDHGFIVYYKDEKLLNLFQTPEAISWKIIEFPYVPTAECIALWCFEQLAVHIGAAFNHNLRIAEVIVNETPTSEAVYLPGDDA